MEPKTPIRGKSKSLEALAKELEMYFPKDVSAAEMIEAERR